MRMRNRFVANFLFAHKYPEKSMFIKPPKLLIVGCGNKGFLPLFPGLRLEYETRLAVSEILIFSRHHTAYQHYLVSEGV
jgi:hypothetical protein